jgi:TPR repeat protein
MYKLFVITLAFIVVIQGCQSNNEIISTQQVFNLREKEKNELIEKANKGDNKASFRLYLYYATNELNYNIMDATQQLYWPWLQKSAEDGNSEAQYVLSQIYFTRISSWILKLCNTEKAIYWLKLSANSGHTSAQKDLEEYERILNGYKISEGRPLPSPLSFNLTNPEKEFLTEKAKKFDNKASFRLYLYYEFTEYYSFERSYWLKKSATDGNKAAQYIIAFELDDMNKTEEAISWLKLSVANGHPLAKKKLESLEYKLKSSEK